MNKYCFISQTPPMGITTAIVQSLLVAEIIAFTLVLLPVPHKKAILHYIRSSIIAKGLKHILLAVYAMVMLLFADSLVKKSKNVGDIYYMYHVERNLYLTSFTLFLALIFYRFVNLLMELKKDEENAKILKKQALNQSGHVQKIIKEGNIKDAKIKELEDYKTKNETLIKQVKNNNDEYFRLLDKYNKLMEKMTGEGKKMA